MRPSDSEMPRLEYVISDAPPTLEPPAPDMVNHPPHYNANPSGVEAITVIEWMTFNVGTAMKYLWRAGHKGDPVEDLEKARWYIDREIQRLEGMT